MRIGKAEVPLSEIGIGKKMVGLGEKKGIQEDDRNT